MPDTGKIDIIIVKII